MDACTQVATAGEALSVDLAASYVDPSSIGGATVEALSHAVGPIEESEMQYNSLCIECTVHTVIQGYLGTE